MGVGPNLLWPASCVQGGNVEERRFSTNFALLGRRRCTGVWEVLPVHLAGKWRREWRWEWCKFDWGFSPHAAFAVMAEVHYPAVKTVAAKKLCPIKTLPFQIGRAHV